MIIDYLQVIGITFILLIGIGYIIYKAKTDK
jgi:hypothetical protein